MCVGRAPDSCLNQTGLHIPGRSLGIIFGIQIKGNAPAVG